MSDTTTRIKQLLNSSPVILFMKGSPQFPMCGFSGQVVHLLKQHGVAFEHFNILEDSEIREGLKQYANWPTFPQLYVNGELLGGCDIIVEMHESGQLAEALGKAVA